MMTGQAKLNHRATGVIGFLSALKQTEKVLQNISSSISSTNTSNSNNSSYFPNPNGSPLPLVKSPGSRVGSCGHVSGQVTPMSSQKLVLSMLVAMITLLAISTPQTGNLVVDARSTDQYGNQATDHNGNDICRFSPTNLNGNSHKDNVELGLWRLKCVLKPLLVAFFNFGHALEASNPALARHITTIASPEVLYELHNSNNIDGFFELIVYVYDRRDFCTFATINELKKAKELAGNSPILNSMYDLISIDFHTGCLRETLEQLPPVPYLVREVVQIYLSGADEEVRVPDSNDDPEVAFEEIRRGRIQELSDKPFDVQEAIAKSGKLEKVVPLLLLMPSKETSKGNLVMDFKDSCRKFLISIEKNWMSMELMNSILATNENQIQSFNNYIMRSLSVTKYSDICSQLSAVG